MKIYFVLALSIISVTVKGDQNEYTVKFDKVEVVSYNKDICEDVVINLFSFNDSSQAINSSGVLKKDLGTDIKVNMEASKMEDNNEYKPITMVKDVDMCDVLDRNQFGLKDLLKYGNFTTCPWKAATYVVNNAMLDFSKLPAKAPPGKYIVNTIFFSGTTELLHTRFSGSVITK